VDEWKVDIISLSFGLRRPNKHISVAIDKATTPDPVTGKSRLVFAAAGNHGMNRSRAWPAQRNDVIGVHASDGNGDSIRSFSPPPFGQGDNFATLGIATKSTWKGREVRRSGTSFAVPVAVAIAANMLGLARRISPEGEKTLYSAQTMKALFKKISLPIGGYRFVAPWIVCESPACHREECPVSHCTHCKGRLRRVLEIVMERPEEGYGEG